MEVHEKIRLFRLQKCWSQEEMADKLKMSQNGYGNIERGETNVSLSRLEEIAAVFGVAVRELFEDVLDGQNGKTVFNLTGANNTQTYFSFNAETEELGYKYLQAEFELEKQKFLSEKKEAGHELEKQKFINEQQEKEITLLKEMNELLKKDSHS